MADVLNATAWQEADASNASGTQPSFPENMPGKDLNNAMRALQGAVKRWVNQICGTKTTAGTAGAYTVAYTQAPEALYNGQRFTVLAHVANTATPTINFNSLGAKTIRKVSGGVVVDLAANEIGANQPLDLMYVSALNCMLWLNPPPPSTSLVDASTTAKGVIEIATRAEIQAGLSAVLAVVPDTIGAILYKGADLAGGTSISLGDGGFFTITGSGWNCTAIVFAAASALGRRALLRFSGTGTLTHGANLTLPTAAPIAVEAGDTCELIQDTSGLYRVINYLRASGAQLATGAAAGVEVQVNKTADTGKTSTTTKTADPHLFFTAKAGKTYEVKVALFATMANTTPGFSFSLGGSTALGRMILNVIGSSDLNGSENLVWRAVDEAAGITSVASFGTSQVMFIEGIILGGAADSVVSVKWAQQVSSANATNLLKESYLTYKERP